MSDIDTGKLRALAEAATPGPWQAETMADYERKHGLTATGASDRFVQAGSRGIVTVCKINGPAAVIPDPYPENNMQFIAEANPATVLALLARLDAMTQALEYYADERRWPAVAPSPIVARNALTAQSLAREML
jgi:hypothetical protein